MSAEAPLSEHVVRAMQDVDQKWTQTETYANGKGDKNASDELNFLSKSRHSRTHPPQPTHSTLSPPHTQKKLQSCIVVQIESGSTSAFVVCMFTADEIVVCKI